MRSLDLFSMAGQVTIVTGAGSGLGRAMAESVAEAGSTVVVADVGSEAAEATAAAIRSAGGTADAVTTDVTDEASVRTLVDGVVDRHGRLDVVFCNAGISGFYRRIDEVDVDEWRRVLDVNLTGVMLTAKHASRVMIPRGSGKLILTASIWGLIGSDSVPIADYAASKGGVVNLTRELGLQLASHGITVNAIAPGFFDTNIGRDKATAAEVKQRLREASLALIPTHRRAQPEEIKGTALFLASAASDMVNGHTLVVDAGCVAR
ncbi:MAG TPA: SDR family NAD(P)-dependent oxidoreductase [Candidatus Saccharimonadales bacterium]|nr:SDR family NAD(P)-dependent oxidoreductase [Candidatus Saccharimonadales bacterium]